MTRPVQKGAVGIGVGEVGGHQFLVPELLEDRLSYVQLVVRKAAEVQHGERFRCPDCDSSPARHLAVGVPPETHSPNVLLPHTAKA